ncbi:hypothetical protein ACWDZ8_26280 [Streptomyces sp. NPDC003233]
MPTAYKATGKSYAAVIAWILQGAARLGLAEVHRSAAYAYGYRPLWLADLTTREQDQAHQSRFPSGRRWDRAERLASAFTVWGPCRMTGRQGSSRPHCCVPFATPAVIPCWRRGLQSRCRRIAAILLEERGWLRVGGVLW